MRIGNIRPQDVLLSDTWQRIYSNTLATAVTSLTISGLDGNTDEEYILITRFVNDNGVNTALRARFNNDSGANYGEQAVNGSDTSVGAWRITDRTGITMCSGTSLGVGAISYGKACIYAKSGYVRTIIVTELTNIKTTTISSCNLTGYSWNNTADNITSIVLTASETNGMGVGTVVELYAKKSKV